jgi:hypothetical protein
MVYPSAEAVRYPNVHIVEAALDGDSYAIDAFVRRLPHDGAAHNLWDRNSGLLSG